MNFNQKVYYKTMEVAGLDIFYREAGNPSNPTFLLMHGFPSSSHMFRHLIPALAQENFHVVAPDFPGFGYSSYPRLVDFDYSFENYGKILSAFVEKKRLKKCALYLHDYGSTIGMRIVLRHPEKIKAL